KRVQIDGIVHFDWRQHGDFVVDLFFLARRWKSNRRCPWRSLAPCVYCVRLFRRSLCDLRHGSAGRLRPGGRPLPHRLRPIPAPKVRARHVGQPKNPSPARRIAGACQQGPSGGTMPAICRLSAALAVGIFSAGVAVAEPSTIGAVDKVQAQVEATQAGQTRALAVASDLYFRDRCRSREGARLQATLKDGTQLTLGENATLVIDEFVYDP